MIRFGSKNFSLTKNEFLTFFNSFSNFELATYPEKPLDSMGFNAKEALNCSIEPDRENLKKNQKKIKNSKLVRPIFLHIFDSISFDTH